jgi:exopolysaccharide production protein ExoZ
MTDPVVAGPVTLVGSGARRLRVEDAGAGRLAWIEALRGIAAAAVVCYHVARHFDANYGMPLLKAMFQFGHSGVDLFFVISGFIILFVHFDDVGRRGRIPRYVERRATRVLPIYWIALLLTVARRWAGGHGTSVDDLAWAILPLPISADPVLGVSWTLQYELVFYAAFGVMIVNRAVGTGVMLGWLAGVVIIAGVGPVPLPEAYWGLSNLEFFGGMAVAYRLVAGGFPRYKIVLAAGVGLFALAGFAEDFGWMDGYGKLSTLGYGLPGVLIVAGCAEASRRGGVRVPVILRMLGAASYSIYLFHFLLIGAMWTLWRASGLDRNIAPALGFVVFLLVSLAGGVVISRWVEYPLMRLLRGLSGRLWPKVSTDAG